MIEVVTLENFKLYHQLLKQYIDEKDSQFMDLVEMTENVLGISEFQDNTDKENVEQEN